MVFSPQLSTRCKIHLNYLYNCPHLAYTSYSADSCFTDNAKKSTICISKIQTVAMISLLEQWSINDSLNNDMREQFSNRSLRNSRNHSRTIVFTLQFGQVFYALICFCECIQKSCFISDSVLCSFVRCTNFRIDARLRGTFKQRTKVAL